MSEKVAVPGCKGTNVQNLLSEEGVQVLKVEVEPGGEIPLHTHECAATMVIIRGRARTLGKDGRVVGTGEVVVKAPKESHGFTEVEEPFAFISISNGDGIYKDGGRRRWDISYL